MIEKIELTKKYEFATFYSVVLIFIIDFNDKSAYFRYPSEKKLFKKENFCISAESYDIYCNSYDIFFKDKLNLSDDKINSFLNEFNKLDLLDDTDFQKLHDIDNLYLYKVNVLCESEKSFKRINYSDDWNKFEEICCDLIGFDFFDSKGIITDYDFDIKKEGIYLNGEKLKLTKVFYHYFIAVALINKEFIIDFNKKRIIGSNSLGWDDKYLINIENNINRLFNLFEKYGVYEWCHIDYYERLNSKDGWSLTFDGYHYYIELIFNDKYVLVLGGHCEHPDTYLNFGREIKDLFGVDLFNISDILNEEEYLFWADKHELN